MDSFFNQSDTHQLEIKVKTFNIQIGFVKKKYYQKSDNI